MTHASKKWVENFPRVSQTDKNQTAKFDRWEIHKAQIVVWEVSSQKAYQKSPPMGDRFLTQ